ncbi:hypothetical protein BDP27DRAFT_1362948 [Rhodocollybia butyracea]|uniref:Uncharacterized protein n=1 Tax=Rhodocollybia butyracea TaxID=206335 RepID=A0A9P5PVR2_9AGAR|nr:hypothetical protein BDP27DRAFT_1362948 [Rhodocollybia butyracea]
MPRSRSGCLVLLTESQPDNSSVCTSSIRKGTAQLPVQYAARVMHRPDEAERILDLQRAKRVFFLQGQAMKVLRPNRDNKNVVDNFYGLETESSVHAAQALLIKRKTREFKELRKDFCWNSSNGSKNDFVLPLLRRMKRETQDTPASVSLIRARSARVIRGRIDVQYGMRENLGNLSRENRNQYKTPPENKIVKDWMSFIGQRCKKSCFSLQNLSMLLFLSLCGHPNLLGIVFIGNLSIWRQLTEKLRFASMLKLIQPDVKAPSYLYHLMRLAICH